MTKGNLEAVAAFQVTRWDQSPSGEDDGSPPHLSRAIVGKRFTGDLEGESTAELLMCQADPKDLAAGAGYVASEQVIGRLAGRAGSFVLQHWGVSDADEQRTGGYVVPGSGTDELVGLSGEVEITVAPDGGHTLTLRYALP